MKTNRDQLVSLRARINLLNDQIVAAGREQEYLAMTKDVAEGKVPFVPLDEDQWQVMLPAEQRGHLLRYYHTLRLELQDMSNEAKKAGMVERATSWLESPWVKRPIAASGIIALAWNVYEQVHNLGLLAKEEKDDDIRGGIA